MHHMLQGIASDKISWLSSSREDPSRLNASEHVKRRQLVDELAFWFYDGFLIPLIRVGYESLLEMARRHGMLTVFLIIECLLCYGNWNN